MEVRPTLQLATSQLFIYVRPYARHWRRTATS